MSFLAITDKHGNVDIIPDGPVAEPPIQANTHVDGSGCPCEPTIVPVERRDGSVGVVVVHQVNP